MCFALRTRLIAGVLSASGESSLSALDSQQLSPDSISHATADFVQALEHGVIAQVICRLVELMLDGLAKVCNLASYVVKA